MIAPLGEHRGLLLGARLQRRAHRRRAPAAPRSRCRTSRRRSRPRGAPRERCLGAAEHGAARRACCLGRGLRAHAGERSGRAQHARRERGGRRLDRRPRRRPRGSPAGRGSGRRSARARSCRRSRAPGTPICRARVAISAGDLALQARRVQPPLADDHRPARAQPAVEVERVEHERRRPRRARAQSAPTARPASPPAAPVIGTPRGQRRRPRGARVRRATAAASAPFCGAEDGRGALERRAHVAEHGQPRAAQAAGLARSPRSRRRRRRCVALPPAATSTCRAPARDRRRRSARPCPALEAASASRSAGCHQREAARLRRPRRAPCARRPAARTRRRSRGPSGSWARAARRSPPALAAAPPSVPSPPSATGREIDARPARSSPRPIACATSPARERPLEGVGGDEHRPAHAGPSCAILPGDGDEGRGDRRSRRPGARCAISNPDKVFFPEPRPHQARPRQLLPRVPGGCRAPPARAPDDAEALGRRRRRRLLLPEARARHAPDWLQTATVHFPSGRTARELVVSDAAHLAWGVNLGVIDWNPWPVRRRDLDRPDELRVDLDPQPEVDFDEVRAVAGCVREVLEEHGLDRLPEDLGLARDPRQRPHPSRSAASRRSAGPRSRSRARSSGGCRAARRASGGRRSASASSSTTTRTPATAPSPRPTRCARSPTRGCRARSTGTSSTTSSRRSCASTRCPRGCASAATRRRRSTSTPARSTACSSWRRATRRRARRRAVAAELPQGRRTRAARVAAESRDEARLGSAPAAAIERELLQLIDRALARRLVLAPAHDLRAVADAPVADVVVADLDDELGAQRDPLEVAVGGPAARLAAAALAGLVGRELAEQLALARGGEGRAVADGAQAAVGLVEAEDQRADGVRPRCRGGSRSRRSRSCAARLTLTIAVRLPGGVGGVQALRDDALGVARASARPRPGRARARSGARPSSARAPRGGARTARSSSSTPSSSSRSKAT